MTESILRIKNINGTSRILLVSAKKSAEASITSMANLTLYLLHMRQQKYTMPTTAKIAILIQYMMLRLIHSSSLAASSADLKSL